VSITAGTALDVIEIDAASHTGVDNIRELIERAQFAPVSCRYKVYVLDEVHMLTSASFNALLKTLEEPPPHVVFVLATTDPQRVLPTVISRCQRFDYQRITLPALVNHLHYIAQQEGIPITPRALEVIAQLSQGGLRDAESLLDQLSLLDGAIDVEQVWTLVGAIPERELLQMLTALESGDPATLLVHLRSLLDQGKEPHSVLHHLASFFRDLILAKTAPQGRELVTLTEETWQALIDHAQRWSLPTLLSMQEKLRQAESLIRQSHQPRLWLEITVLELLPRDPGIPPADQLPNARPPEAAQPPAPSPLPVSYSAKPSPPAQPPPQPPTPVPVNPPTLRLSSQWEDFLARLSPLPRARLHLGKIIHEEVGMITIAFPTPAFADKARQNLKELQTVAAKLLGYPIQFELISQAPASPPPPPRTEPAPVSSHIPPPDPPTAQPSEPPPEVLHNLHDLEEAAHQVAHFFGGAVIDISPADLATLDLPKPEIPF
jgi:DNA polymerase-3 subunit gamma/tau